jgi:hypothetical protein
MKYDDGSFHCSVCNKTFAKDTVFKAHIASPKHKTAETKYEQTIRDISKLEFLINRLGDLLADAIVATKENIQKKQARRHDEDINDDDEEIEMPDLDEEIEEVRLTKKFYPVGWDGNPIPFWCVRPTPSCLYAGELILYVSVGCTSYMVLVLSISARYAVTPRIGAVAPSKSTSRIGVTLTA